ncbi:MAG: hypothetical protein K2Y30_01165 [Flavobacteriaceae bacterium]|nr:hypothetical protein [Flavobacteriaceae bacterium]
METLEGLNDLIYKRLIEKNGNIKLTENNDIVRYANAVGIPENQLLFLILEVEEKIDWTEIDKKKKQASTEVVLNASNSNKLYCKNCNAENEKGIANFCVECGSELKSEPQPEPTYQPAQAFTPDKTYEQNPYVAPQDEPTKKSKTQIILIGIFTVLVALVLGYFFWGKDYLRDKNATRMYSFARSLALRSSPAGGGDYNMIGNIPYGSEVLVYDNGIDWVNCKVNDQEGFASPKYLLNKMDFQELNAILADEDTRTAVTQTRFKKALISYFRNNNLIGQMDEEIQKDIYGAVTTKEVWQLFAKAESTGPNTVYFSKKSNQNSKFNDFACIIKNNSTGARKILIFSFDDNEIPKFEGEAEAPAAGYIASIEYDYGSLTPTYTSW